MAIFLVSFLIFSAAALLLWLSQRVRGERLPVGCTPETGECCMGFGNCIEPTDSDRGNFEEKGVRHWSVPTERS